MNRGKIISIICVCCLVLSVIFTSCTGSIDTFTSTDGVEHRIVRDDKGNIVLNDNGELAVYVTNENGKIRKDDAGNKMIEYISFDGQLFVDGQVESKDLSYTVPTGFTVVDNMPNYFEHSSGKAQIFLSFTDTITSNDAISTVLSNCKRMQDDYGADKFKFEQGTIDGKNTEIKMVKIESTAPEYNKTTCYYFIDFANGYYRFNCTAESSVASKINFDKLAKSVQVNE